MYSRRQTPSLRDPEADRIALQCHEIVLDEIGSGGFGSVFEGTLKRSRGETNLLYRSYFNGKYASWDLSRSSIDRADVEPLTSSFQHDLVKVVLKKLEKGSDTAVIREASKLQKLRGPRNVVSVYGVIKSEKLEGSRCIVMEKVDGVDFNTFLQRRGDSDVSKGASWWWKTKLEIFREIVLGVVHCHRNEIVHGDLKGENVIVDQNLVPKLIDFGLSFAASELDYIKSLENSFFWAAPEVEDLDELRGLPFACDVYSLGMILVEMSLDGDVPSELSESYLLEKMKDGPIVSFAIPEDEDAELVSVLVKIKESVDECCKAEKEERLSLEDLLVKIEDAHTELCNICQVKEAEWDKSIQLKFISHIAPKLRELSVPECVLREVHLNLMVNAEGELLVHVFCKVDFFEGIEYIIHRGFWRFEPEVHVPEMALVSVQWSSVGVLKYLGANWTDLVAKQWSLVHEACKQDSPEVLRFLLFDLEMPYDTWGREDREMMPIHKLAMRGKRDMIQVILDRDIEQVDAFVDPHLCKNALYYATRNDDMETASFLLSKGSSIFSSPHRKKEVRRVVDVMFILACKKACFRVLAGLLELPKDGSECSDIVGIDASTCKSHSVILRRHVEANAQCKSAEFLKVACRKTNEDVFECFVWLFARAVGFENAKMIDRLLRYVCEMGSKRMMEVLNQQMTQKMWRRTYITEYPQEPDALTLYLKLANEHGNTEVRDYLHSLYKQQQEPEDEEQAVEPTPAQLLGMQSESKFNSELELPLEAIEEGNVEKLRKAISCLDEDRITAKFFEACVTKCCSRRNLDMIKFLESVGMDSAHPEICVMHHAAFHGAVHIIRYCLEKGIDVNRRGHYYGVENTALHCASQRCNIDVMKLLLDAGASPNVENADGWTCMDDALIEENWKMVELLIEYGFDTAKKNRYNVRYMKIIADGKWR